MTGRAEVWRLRQVLCSVINRVGKIDYDPELQSDLAKYICILVSGYVETAVRELLLEHSRQHAAPTVQRFVEFRTQRLTNLNSERLKQLLGSFDPDWGDIIQEILIDEKKDALNSVISLRNSISHGQNIVLTYRRIVEYFEYIEPIVDTVADICDPNG